MIYTSSDNCTSVHGKAKNVKPLQRALRGSIGLAANTRSLQESNHTTHRLQYNSRVTFAELSGIGSSYSRLHTCSTCVVLYGLT